MKFRATNTAAGPFEFDVLYITCDFQSNVWNELI